MVTAPTIQRLSAVLFGTTAPGALANWLLREHGFTERFPLASEVYRLACDGMVIVIFADGLCVCEGRQPDAALLLLADLCVEEGDAA